MAIKPGVCMFVLIQASMKILSNVVIKVYGSALWSKYKDKLLPYNCTFLCSVKPNPYLLIEVSKLYTIYMLLKPSWHSSWVIGKLNWGCCSEWEASVEKGYITCLFLFKSNLKNKQKNPNSRVFQEATEKLTRRKRSILYLYSLFSFHKKDRSLSF